MNVERLLISHLGMQEQYLSQGEIHANSLFAVYALATLWQDTEFQFHRKILCVHLISWQQ